MPAVDDAFVSGFTVPTEIGTGSGEAPAAPTTVAQPILSQSCAQGADCVETTGPTAFVSASAGSPVPAAAKPSSERISTRTLRPTATAAGNAPLAVDHGFRPGGAFRPSVKRLKIPSRVLQPRPAPSIAATRLLSPQLSSRYQSRPTRDHAEPVETPPLRPPPPSGNAPAAPKHLDGLGDAAEWQLTDSVARYLHAVWKREQQAEPT